MLPGSVMRMSKPPEGWPTEGPWSALWHLLCIRREHENELLSPMYTTGKKAAEAAKVYNVLNQDPDILVYVAFEPQGWVRKEAIARQERKQKGKPKQ